MLATVHVAQPILCLLDHHGGWWQWWEGHKDKAQTLHLSLKRWHPLSHSRLDATLPLCYMLLPRHRWMDL